MKLKEIEKFADDCFHRGVELPKNLVFECEDWNDAVPEEFINHEEVEVNYRPSDDDVVKIMIKPLPKPIAVEVGTENPTLNELSQTIHKANVKKGFYEDAQEVRDALIPYGNQKLIDTFEKAITGQRLMLIVSEAAETLEGNRKDKFFPNTKDFELPNSLEHFKIDLLNDNEKDRFKEYFETFVKDTQEDEVADILIRVLDFCGAYGIDIDFHVDTKLRYNSLRPHKHGKIY